MWSNGRRERVAVEAGETRQRRGALVGGQARVGRDAPRCALRRARATAGGVKRASAAVAQGELPGAADLLDQRAAGGVRHRRERPEPDTAAPQHERDQRQREHHDRRAVAPEQREQRGMVVFREENAPSSPAPQLAWRPRTASRDRRRTGSARGTASR